MKYRLLIHDLPEAEAGRLIADPDVLIFAAQPSVRHCVGCFGCWTKTPGVCVIKDRCAQVPAMMAASRELILVSRCVYGGFSPDIKAVLDRNVGYISPFFCLVDGEMHHVMRYDNPFRLIVHFYGADIQEEEMRIARRLVGRNVINLGAASHEVVFHHSCRELEGVLA